MKKKIILGTSVDDRPIDPATQRIPLKIVGFLLKLTCPSMAFHIGKVIGFIERSNFEKPAEEIGNLS